MTIDALAVKKESERIVLEAGGQICDWLPVLDVDVRKLRSVDEVRDRALVMNALINLAFQAPVHIIAGWIRENGVEHALTEHERVLLTKTQLGEQDLINFHWYLESLWSLMWAGGLIDRMDFTEGVPDSMASLCPNLQRGEDGSKFAGFKLRPYEEIFRELDLHYRLHWYARNGLLTKTPTPPVEHSVILERRKALEWVLDPSHAWDDVRLDT
ncbi:MAG: DUF4272 domain-containing protein [Archangium sp.]